MPKPNPAQSKKVKALTKAANKKRYEMIAHEAHLLAEQRDFIGGDPVQDWLEAEKKVNEMLDLDF
jgi:hypothetical protein